MTGLDWNRDGKRDDFDRFIEYKIIEEVNNESDNANVSRKVHVASDSKKKEECDVPLWKSLLVIALCVGVFLIPMFAELGKLLMGILCIGVAFLGYFILKS